MKNLFNISQEEQNRILYLHETATKKLYLSEQWALNQLFKKSGGDKYYIVDVNGKVVRMLDYNNESDTNLPEYGSQPPSSTGTKPPVKSTPEKMTNPVPKSNTNADIKSVIRVAPTTVEQITQGKGFLRRGDKGDLVKQLQQLLKNHPNKYFTDEPNGIFGPKTNDGVIKFQSEVMKMTNPDGKVGKITWSYLNNSEPITKKDISEPMTKKEISLPVNDKEYQLKQPSETPQVSQNTNTVTNTKVDVTPQVVDSKLMEPF